MNTPIRSAAVLGAGTMGAQIAAHLANAGVPVVLLDLTADAAREGLKRARGAQARSVLHARHAALDQRRRLRHRLRASRGVDWIVEAVVEQLDVKRALLERVDAVAARRAPSCRSNTSGIPIAALAEGRSDGFRRHWLGTHFFNPPRYLPPARGHPDAGHRSGGRRARSRGSPISGSARAWSSPRTRRTSSPITSASSACAQILRALDIGRVHDRGDRRHHGPGDRPAQERDVPHHGHRRPRRARPRRAELRDRLTDDELRRQFALPRSCSRSSSAAGSARRPGRASTSGKQRRSESWRSIRRRSRTGPQQPVRLPVARCRARTSTTPASASRRCFSGAGQGRRVPPGDAGSDAALRGARRARHRAFHRRRRSRHAMGLRLGAGAVRDLGRHRHSRSLDAADRKTQARPRLVDDTLAVGRNRFRDGGVPPAGPDLQILKAAQGSAARGQAQRRAPASSISGDGVLAVEFHSKMNTIGADTVQMLHAGIEGGRGELRRARRRQRGAELLCRREPDAGAARSAGGQLGRDRPDGPRVPRRDTGAALCRRPGRRRAGGHDAWRRLRDRPARRPRPGGGRELHRPGRSRRRPDSGRRRHQGDARAQRRATAADARRPRCRSSSGSSRRSASRRSRRARADAAAPGFLRDATASR